MALITISGYPSSGKSRRAQQIIQEFEKRLSDPNYSGPSLKVVCVSDDSLNVDRSAYDDSRSEKPARGTLFTAIQRHMGSNTLLIVDAPNYIKGFRYQMYCAAREMKVRVCTVYVIATQDQCKEWNAARQDGKAYKQETLENLIQRYEEPSSMVRWDSPLFTIPWTDTNIPGDDIWRAVTEGIVKPPNVGTQVTPKAPTSALHTLETTTTAFVSAILSSQALSPGTVSETMISLPLSESSGPPLKVHTRLPARTLTIAELQRLKRQFINTHKKAITLGSAELGRVDWGEESVAKKFATYLEENLRP